MGTRRGVQLDITISGRSGRRRPGALVVAPAPKLSVFDVVFNFVDGLFKLVAVGAVMIVLLILVAIGMAFVGFMTWVLTSAIMNLQDWAAWTITGLVEASAVILMIGHARK